MVKIYCIEDCNNLKYVGSTNKTLSQRLSRHKCEKKNCSSKKLDLDNCKIYVLEETDEEHRIEREKYWIHKIDCVNKIRYDFDNKQYQKEYHKEYHKKNRDKNKKYREKNRDKKSKYDISRRQYRKSFGGDERYHNNLLLIDLSIFN